MATYDRLSLLLLVFYFGVMAKVSVNSQARECGYRLGLREDSYYMADFDPKTVQFLTQIDWNASYWRVSKLLGTSTLSATES